MSETARDAKGIFLAALDIAEDAERAAFVERSCGGDAELKRRVDDLLRAYCRPDGPLDKLAAALAPTDLTEPVFEHAGTMIGRYKLIELIGEGAMGSVWMAQQTEPVKRLVAIKLIKAGSDSKTVLSRFEAERQALALMDHPNIAKVFDGGASQAGSPYFAMELIKGVPITRYCDERKLTPRERLALFVPVCRAVQHAHQKGVIHRDLKPTNVLVAQYDGRPVPKVIDFGVAKAVGQPLTERTLVTGFGALIGTPAYMSPEQAELNQLDIDTRSDIYALGVLLYEKLTGSTPFGKEELAQAGLFEILRVIRENDPPRPSTRLSTADALPTIAANRGTEPSTLTGILRSELDWIVMKALEKDRNRRYETAASFAVDIERYLSGEVVQAHPPSAVYRLRKFARKNRRSVIALAAIAAALIVGIAGTTSGLIRARIAEHGAKTAERAAVESELKAVGAFEQVTKERDATERQLANGLLRPVGFSSPIGFFSRGSLDAAELRSFVDWSAIKESSLKLRVLEIAFQNPETAIRVARRAERSIQSCVGLSPTRRENAIKLVSAKQRDLSSDPRIRVAACWLAMELGSADLPAWIESCNYLIEPKNKSSDRFGEFVNFAASHCDQRQIAQLNLDSLIAMLEKPRVDNVLLGTTRVIGMQALRQDPAQVKRAGDALIAPLEESKELGVESSALAVLAPWLEPKQAKRAGEALIAILEKSAAANLLSGAKVGLTGPAPRLEPAPVGDYTTYVANDVLTPVLTALAPRLEPAQVKRAGDALIGMLEKPRDFLFFEASTGLTALAPQLEPAQVKRAGDALIAILEKPADANVLSAAEAGLTGLAPRLESAQVKRSWNALMAILEKRGSDLYFANDVLSPLLKALAPRLDSAQAQRSGDSLIVNLERETDVATQRSSSIGLAALAPRLESALVKRAGDALIAIDEKSTNSKLSDEASIGLAARAPRLESAQVKRASSVLIAILEKRGSDLDFTDDVQAQALKALAPRLDSAQAQRAGDSLIVKLERETDVATQGPLNTGLAALAPRLEPAQAHRAVNALTTILEKSADHQTHAVVEDVLVALLPRLEPALRDKLSMRAATVLLDDGPRQPPIRADVAGPGRANIVPAKLSEASLSSRLRG